jgi:hypothetical protein
VGLYDLMALRGESLTWQGQCAMETTELVRKDAREWSSTKVINLPNDINNPRDLHDVIMKDTI